MEFKTANEWYKEDTSVDIRIFDGWGENYATAIKDYNMQYNEWHYKPITYETYKHKRDQCSTVEYMRLGHKHPFTDTPSFQSTSLLCLDCIII
jgi:hypothetical protein